MRDVWLARMNYACHNAQVKHSTRLEGCRHMDEWCSAATLRVVDSFKSHIDVGRRHEVMLDVMLTAWTLDQHLVKSQVFVKLPQAYHLLFKVVEQADAVPRQHTAFW